MNTEGIYYLEAMVDVGKGMPLKLVRMVQAWSLLLPVRGRKEELGCLGIR